MKILLSFFLSSLISYVNPFVGTSNFGATNPGAVCPNAMMSVSPFNVMGSNLNKFDKDARWWSTPYTSDNVYFTGFSHINLSGVGCPDVGTILVMPTNGELEVDYKKYGSCVENENASPGYYTNKLTKYNIKTEVSTTIRSSIERFTFPKGNANILINLGQGLTNESGAYIKKVNNNEIEGMRFAGGFCYNSQAVFPIYFVLRINKDANKTGFWKKQPEMTAEAAWDEYSSKYKIYNSYNRELAGDDIGYFFSFDSIQEGEQIEIQIGVSFVSTKNARENLDREQKKVFDFEKVKKEAQQLWEENLSRIIVKGGSKKQKEIFYTALYHSLIHPSILNDINGEYPSMEEGVLLNKNNKEVSCVEKGENRYTVFSLWDTYRNLHQLMTLVYPEKQRDMLRSMVAMYKEWGWLPKWELFGRETFTMEGDPAIPVITDSWLKGLKDFDIQTAYQAAIKSATTKGQYNKMRPDIDPYLEKSYIPIGFYAADFSGDNSVSHALEYYVADYALSLLAEDLGKQEDAELFRKRSLGYKNYFSKEFSCLRPICKDGNFLTPFNPRQGENFEPTIGFHEGSAWNYTFFVPHDIKGLAKLMGGKKAFIKNLQKVFDENLFDPSNEPDIAYPYLFSQFKGEEWRTAKTVKRILEKYYTTHPAGIPGNDDTGTMSAWAVFSMMGFYPDCPGAPYYTLTEPTFDKITIKLAPEYNKGKDKIVIEKKNFLKKFKKYRVPHSLFIQKL